MSQSKKKPLIGIGLDLGSAYSAASFCIGGKVSHFESPIDGEQVPTIAYQNADTGEWHFGRDAVQNSYDDPRDRLFMHFKRNFLESPHEKVYADEFSPAELLCGFLSHKRDIMLAARPELQDYPQFGGSAKPEHELAMFVGVPANWGFETLENFRAVIHKAGFPVFDGFVAEPIAAARYAVHVNNVHLQNGDLLFAVDVGAGTTDIAMVDYNHGVYNQVAAASGNAFLAGHDFTAAIAEVIADEFGVPWDGAFGKGGLNLRGCLQTKSILVLAA